MKDERGGFKTEFLRAGDPAAELVWGLGSQTDKKLSKPQGWVTEKRE